MKRPPLSWAMPCAVCATRAGVREKMVMMPVASAIRSVWAAT